LRLQHILNVLKTPDGLYVAAARTSFLYQPQLVAHPALLRRRTDGLEAR